MNIEAQRPHLRLIRGKWYCFTRPLSIAIGVGETPQEALDDYELTLLGKELVYPLPDDRLLKQVPAG